MPLVFGGEYVSRGHAAQVPTSSPLHPEVNCPDGQATHGTHSPMWLPTLPFCAGVRCASGTPAESAACFAAAAAAFTLSTAVALQLPRLLANPGPGHRRHVTPCMAGLGSSGGMRGAHTRFCVALQMLVSSSVSRLQAPLHV